MLQRSTSKVHIILPGKQATFVSKLTIVAKSSDQSHSNLNGIQYVISLPCLLEDDGFLGNSCACERSVSSFVAPAGALLGANSPNVGFLSNLLGSCCRSNRR